MIERPRYSNTIFLIIIILILLAILAVLYLDLVSEVQPASTSFTVEEITTMGYELSVNGEEIDVTPNDPITFTQDQGYIEVGVTGSGTRISWKQNNSGCEYSANIRGTEENTIIPWFDSGNDCSPEALEDFLDRIRPTLRRIFGNQANTLYEALIVAITLF